MILSDAVQIDAILLAKTHKIWEKKKKKEEYWTLYWMNGTLQRLTHTINVILSHNHVRTCDWGILQWVGSLFKRIHYLTCFIIKPEPGLDEATINQLKIIYQHMQYLVIYYYYKDWCDR